MFSYAFKQSNSSVRFGGSRMILFAYLLVAIIVFVFLRYPKWGVLAAIFIRPTIDMFWWAKSQGYVSPLYIIGVVVPMLAIFSISKIHFQRLRVPMDNLIIAYLAVFSALTLMKIVNSPQYAFGSIESLSRIMSVTLFYFVGRYYFQTPKDIKFLIAAVLGSAIFPFALTLGQQMLGINLTHFSDVYAAAGPGVGTGDVSGYYMHGRHNLVRISGVYEGVYELAFMGAISALLVYSLVSTTGYRPKIWHFGLLAASCYLLYFTYSRSAWITAIVTILLFFVFRREYTRLILCVGLCLVMYLLVDNVQYRFEDELGFLAGESSFHSFGYSRGGLWIQIFEDFSQQGFIERTIGNYGLGNAENQFLGTLIWFGYIGLATLILLIVILSFSMTGWLLRIRDRRSAVSNAQLMMGCFAIASYWFAGQGNHFITQISTQWIIWTWVGAIATSAAVQVRERKMSRRDSLANHET